MSVTRPVPASITESIASSGRVRGVTETLAGAQAAGVVERLFVREGDRVSAGQRLAILKSDVAEARVAQAEAALTTAQATLVQVARGALPSEVEAAAAQVQQARAQLAQQQSSLAQAEQTVVQAEAQLAQHQAERELAARQLERAERLLERGLIARAEHDEAVTRSRVVEQQVAAQRQAVAVAETVVRAFRGGVAAAEANVGVQEARLRTLEVGARPEDVAIARERVREAERALAVARRQAQEAVVVAPFGGVVTAINAEVGQTVGSQGVLQLVSTEMEIRVEVDETNLADLALGQSAVVSSSAFPGSTFAGSVREIAAAVDQTRGTVTVTVAPIEAAGLAASRPDGQRQRRDQPGRAATPGAGGGASSRRGPDRRPGRAGRPCRREGGSDAATDEGRRPGGGRARRSTTASSRIRPRSSPGTVVRIRPSTGRGEP